MTEQVATHTDRMSLPAAEPLTAYLALSERFGSDQVFLLESAGGPASDSRQHFVGFGELLAVSVTTGKVTVTGVEALRRTVLSRITPLLEPDSDRPRLRAGYTLWDLIRTVESTFDVPGSADGFEFGFMAYLGYDVARYIEELPYLIEPGPDLPDFHAVLYQGVLHTEVGSADSTLILHRSELWPSLNPAELAAVLSGGTDVPDDARDVAVELIEDDITRDHYLSIADKCLGHIAIGDIYQVQIGHEVAMHSAADPIDVYRRLRARNASPYMYLATVADHTIIGASPELFVRVEDGEVVMRPIAGTLPRNGDDEAGAARLSGDPKEIAEHVMLVDLCRNDIGRICLPDSLDVRESMVVEKYSHVLHLVSTVVGQAAEDTDSYDIIAALFPAGTMTGAPKIRAMEIIEEVETSRRGLYAGALGLIGFGGYLNLALCIRTLIHHEGVYRTRASAGVVADSDPGREWAETLAKSNAAYWAVTGRELS
ncbi:anthranilate synthase component I family protein [Kibdelosporangium philippinense]|uniref:Anthranilate synthase component I family protein n=1 Tax=Kibdelosporangium philippinense TaxID=211113 RepID=A0ABS8Z5K2_9PSEU|nr:anthranilate synthase component I family protein [Kibdelosporangium philippinense]MCE7002304.1 anthranilate synthase component I family protein [Kibdelosporangium philippinense]